MAALAGVGAIVGAVIAATKAMGKAVGGFVDDLGGIAAHWVSASTDFTQPMQAAGASLREEGEKLTSLGQGFGIVLIGAGAAVQQFSRVLGELNGMAERYAELNPEIAFAEAMGDMRLIMDDFRRGQEIAPKMVKFIQARTEVQARVEDIKVQFMQAILPIATKALGRIEEGLEIMQVWGPIILQALVVVPGLGAVVQAILDEMQKDEGDLGLIMPTDLIMNMQEADARRGGDFFQRRGGP